jgi:hypothetical protein
MPVTVTQIVFFGYIFYPIGAKGMDFGLIPDGFSGEGLLVRSASVDHHWIPGTNKFEADQPGNPTSAKA